LGFIETLTLTIVDISIDDIYAVTCRMSSR
jgi:hypothetical protein